MREIKFRGRSTKSGNWLFGDLLHNRGKVYVAPVEGFFFDGATEADFEADPATVGQYTGLKNREGIEIFDGDVLCVNGRYYKLVKYIPVKAAFCMANIAELSYDDIDPWTSVYHDWWENTRRTINVIGNIHDNPELLKPKQD